MDPKRLPLAVLMTLGLSDGCIFKPCLSMVIDSPGDSDDDSGADDSGADDSAADDSAADDSATEARSAAEDRAAATQRVLARGALPADVAAALNATPKE